ncbi:hypothetical protein HYW35_02035 [Candidatus Saccharibacteria bacterium]|nr:hypothetical protein [Candidatus Saccharibacteria bacterium]
MNKQIDIKLYLAKLKKFRSAGLKHISFTVILLMLLMYLFTVWRVSQLATAEPTSAAENAALNSANIPRIDKNAIKQIEALEKSNIQVHSLFNSARNNPFSE